MPTRAPRLGQAPRQYDQRFFDSIIAELIAWATRLNTAHPFNASALNINIDTLPTQADTATLRHGDVYRDTAVSDVLRVWRSGGGAWGTGGVTDGDKGDITVSAGGATWTIDAGVVTYSKIQNVSATDKLLGRSTAGAGVVEEIPLTAAGRALIDDVDASAQRTTLGLGTLATQSGTFSGTHSGTSSGTNTGDQTSIVGITGTLAEFNTALTGADFATGGGTATGTNTGDQTSIVGITGTKAQFDTAVTDGNILYVGDVVGLTDGDKGDITVSASGATWTIDVAAVTLAKQADVATATVFYRKTAGTGVPEVQTLATLKTDLGLTGTNTGDQTSIVGITGTLAQFNTACTDADFARTDAANTFIGIQTFSTPIATASVATMTATVGGGVPTPPNNTTTFLRGDGTFAAPPGGAFAVYETEIDFGTTPVSEASFTVTVVGMTTAHKLLTSMSYAAPTGKDQDELEMDDLQIRAVAGTGNFTMYIRAADGSYLADTFKINYSYA